MGDRHHKRRDGAVPLSVGLSGLQVAPVTGDMVVQLQQDGQCRRQQTTPRAPGGHSDVNPPGAVALGISHTIDTLRGRRRIRKTHTLMLFLQVVLE